MIVETTPCRSSDYDQGATGPRGIGLPHAKRDHGRVLARQRRRQSRNCRSAGSSSAVASEVSFMGRIVRHRWYYLLLVW